MPKNEKIRDKDNYLNMRNLHDLLKISGLRIVPV
jgi:hypothetical protein